jgi:hypothetical protein
MAINYLRMMAKGYLRRDGYKLREDDGQRLPEERWL